MTFPEDYAQENFRADKYTRVMIAIVTVIMIAAACISLFLVA